MPLPSWVAQFKEPKTEIKLIKGGYYKYRVDYKYNPEKKRTDKVSGVLLGKVTEQGFEPSDKDKFRKTQGGTSVDIKNFGLYHLCSSLMEEELKSLGTFFPPVGR